MVNVSGTGEESLLIEPGLNDEMYHLCSRTIGSPGTSIGLTVMKDW